MKKENVVKVVIISLICPVLYFGLQLLVVFVYGILYGVIHAAEREADYAAFAEKANASIAANGMFLTLVSIVIFFAVIFIFFKVKRKSLSERVSWKPAPSPVYGLIAAAAVASLISCNLLMSIVLPDNVLEEVSDYSGFITSGGIVLTIVIGVLLGPIGEEIAYRGFMMKRLGMRFPAWFAVALTALLFSASHYMGGIGQLIGTAWIGVFLGLVFLWTKSIRASIFAHILNNAIALLLPETLFAELEETSPPVRLIVSVVCLAVMVCVMRLIYQRREKEEEKEACPPEQPERGEWSWPE